MNHPRDWSASLGRDVVPRLGDRPVSEATSTDLLDVLTPIRHSKPGTARRARQRISAVMQWAVAMEFRTDNPGATASEATLGRQRGRGAAPAGVAHGEVASARSGELRLAQWTEIDRDAGVWTISAGRMKANREHRVPLSRDPCRRQRSQVRPFLGQPRRPSKRTMTFRSQSAREGPHSIKDHLRGWQHLQHAPSIARTGHDRRASGHARPGSARRRAPLGAALIDEAQAAPIAGAVVFVVATLSLSAAMDGDVMAQELLEDASDPPRIVDAARDRGQRFPLAATRKTSNVWSRAPALPIQAPGPASPFTASCGSCCAPG